jgi:hypothetical protein
VSVRADEERFAASREERVNCAVIGRVNIGAFDVSGRAEIVEADDSIVGARKEDLGVLVRPGG